MENLLIEKIYDDYFIDNLSEMNLDEFTQLLSNDRLIDEFGLKKMKNYKFPLKYNGPKSFISSKLSESVIFLPSQSMTISQNSKKIKINEQTQTDTYFIVAMTAGNLNEKIRRNLGINIENEKINVMTLVKNSSSYPALAYVHRISEDRRVTSTLFKDGLDNLFTEYERLKAK